MSNIWTQSKFGRVKDPVDPNPDEVDFREICETLSHINRYNGCADHLQVSVAFHSLIAIDAAEPAVKPWVLIHDFHEAVIGDITTPAEWALIEIASRTFGPGAAGIVKESFSRLKRGLDKAIHTAAGLDMPTELQRAAVKAADIVSLRTERRDFLVPAPKPWGAVYENAKPLLDDYRHRWAPPMQIADQLYAKCVELLPSLQMKVAA